MPWHHCSAVAGAVSGPAMTVLAGVAPLNSANRSAAVAGCGGVCARVNSTIPAVAGAVGGVPEDEHVGQPPAGLCHGPGHGDAGLWVPAGGTECGLVEAVGLPVRDRCRAALLIHHLKTPSPCSSAPMALTRRASGGGGVGAASSVRRQVGVPSGVAWPGRMGHGSGGGPGSWEGQGLGRRTRRAAVGPSARRSRSIGVEGAAAALG